MHILSPLFSPEPNYTPGSVNAGHRTLSTQEISISRRMRKHTRIPGTTELVVSLVFFLWYLLILAQGNMMTMSELSVQTEAPGDTTWFHLTEQERELFKLREKGVDPSCFSFSLFLSPSPQKVLRGINR